MDGHNPLDHERQPHEKRVADALEDHRDALERVAGSDTAFASRAEAALDWLDEHETDAEPDDE